MCRGNYDKPWLSISGQLQRLMDRGLIIPHRDSASDFLSHVGYYRFSGYCLAFEEKRHEFLPGTTFEQVRDAYLFDSGLRRLLCEAIEEIEIYLRTAVAYTFGKTYGAFGHLDPENFFKTFSSARKSEKTSRYSQWMTRVQEETKRSQDVFTKHFKQTYHEFPDLPIWTVTETMSFGALSRMLEGMDRKDRKAISDPLGIDWNPFASWVHHLCYVRNLCAHYARVWDRIWSITPQMPFGSIWNKPSIPSTSRLFVTLLMIRRILSKVPALRPYADNWKQWIEELLESPPACPDPYTLMGLPEKWESHRLWTLDRK